MNLKIGIVGLPNVGKSTLFNALTKSRGAVASNYPFCTIDPNVGIVEVFDERLTQLAQVVKTQKIVPAVVEFVDIAGLVKGAHKGEGLGNQFLAHIREVDAILEVVRFFEDPQIIHVEPTIDAKRDMETIRTELILADLQTLEKKIAKAASETKSGDRKMVLILEILKKIKGVLDENKFARETILSKEEQDLIKDLALLTFKPFLYAINLKEEQLKEFGNPEKLAPLLGLPAGLILPISAKLEEELIDLSEAERSEYLKNLGINYSGLNLLAKDCFETLKLQYFFTAGEKEARAWVIKQGWTAPQAAGVIHTDFEKGFIKADVCHWQDFVNQGGWVGCREKGLVRQEGKDYVMREGDVVLFKFNV